MNNQSFSILEDQRKQNGGARAGAGRKPKADEIALIERMDSILAPEEVWEALADLVKDRDHNATKTWLSYRFGMPKQSVDHTTGGDKIQSPTPLQITMPDGTTLDDFKI